MTKKSIFMMIAVSLNLSPLYASGLPKASMQAMMKALQDQNVEVRTAAAGALEQVAGDAEEAAKPLESVLIASADPKEQEACVKALVAIKDKDSAKRLSDALANPQFTWGAGAKARAVEVVGKVGEKKMVKWLTSLLASEQEPAVEAAALKALGEIGAPPKKEEKK